MVACVCESFALHFQHRPEKSCEMTRSILASTALRATVAVATLALSQFAMAEPEALLVIKGHRFEPAELKVPAGQRVKLTVHNQDPTPEEFESCLLYTSPSP